MIKKENDVAKRQADFSNIENELAKEREKLKNWEALLKKRENIISLKEKNNNISSDKIDGDKYKGKEDSNKDYKE